MVPLAVTKKRYSNSEAEGHRLWHCPHRGALGVGLWSHGHSKDAQLQSRHESSTRQPPPEKQSSHKKTNMTPSLESCSLRAKCSQSLRLPSKEQSTGGKRRRAEDSEKFP